MILVVLTKLIWTKEIGNFKLWLSLSCQLSLVIELDWIIFICLLIRQWTMLLTLATIQHLPITKKFIKEGHMMFYIRCLKISEKISKKSNKIGRIFIHIKAISSNPSEAVK